MRHLPRLLAVWLLILALPATATDTGRDVAYSDVAKLPMTLKKVDPSGIYSVSYRVAPAAGQTGLPPDIRLEIRLPHQVVPLTLQAEGRFELPLRQDWLDGDTRLWINQPKDRVAISMNVTARVPPGTEMSYARLAESAPVMQRGIKELAGMMSFMAPKVRSLRLGFPPGPGQRVSLTLANGERKQWQSDAAGHVDIPWDEAWRDARVTLGAPLVSIGPVVN